MSKIFATAFAFSLLLVSSIAWSGPSSEPAANAAAQDPIRANDSQWMAVFDKQYAEAWAEGAIPAKYKELSGVTLSVVIRCEGCLEYHVHMAARHGAKRQEIVEALRLGIVAGGSAGTPSMKVAYTAMDELKLK